VVRGDIADAMKVGNRSGQPQHLVVPASADLQPRDRGPDQPLASFTDRAVLLDIAVRHPGVEPHGRAAVSRNLMLPGTHDALPHGVAWFLAAFGCATTAAAAVVDGDV